MMLNLDAPLVFIDTETTHLDLGKARAWEVALIRRDPLEREQTAHFMIAGVDLDDADPESLKVGDFHDRYGPGSAGTGWVTEEDAARMIRSWTLPHLGVPAILVGSNPSYDAQVLAALLRRHDLEPSWYHHTFDLHTATIARLADDANAVTSLTAGAYGLSRAAGAAEPSETTRHTALGDARWAARWWDALMERGTLA